MSKWGQEYIKSKILFQLFIILLMSAVIIMSPLNSDKNPLPSFTISISTQLQVSFIIL